MHVEFILIHWNILDPLNYRLISISRHHQMYVTVIQKVSVPLEVLVSLFDSCKNLAPIESLHFSLRTLLLTTILHCIKSEHLWYTYILGNQYWSCQFTQLMLVGDGDWLLCLVMFCSDNHKRRAYLYAHIPCTPWGIYQIKGIQFIEPFILIKIQTFNNKNSCIHKGL